MAIIDTAAPSEPWAAPGRATALLAVFTAAIFTSATLIFWVEPLFAKMVLPLMGGAPAVWITALMFYQAVLFAGYAYAHALATALPVRAQMAVHAAMIGAAGLTLPFAVPDAAPAAGPPAMQVLELLASGVGLPLFVLSATAPLLQRWFAGTDHPQARDPYFLYAASNVGSLGALLAFPLLIEPRVGGGVQAVAWAAGFGVAALLVLGAAALAWRSRADHAQADHAGAAVNGKSAAPAWPVRLRWLLMAAVPSSLLSGTTTRIGADIAAGPLFWAVPLALYLVTFILAFSGRRPIPLRLALPAQAVLLAPVVVAAFGGLLLIGEWTTAAAMLLLLFVSAYLCHLGLAESRPGPARLTEFYLWIAAGGMLGGAFNALAAPALFTGIAEFPLALVLAVALRPDEAEPGGPAPGGAGRSGTGWWGDLRLPVVLSLLAAAAIWLSPPAGEVGAKGVAGCALAVVLVVLWSRTRRLAAMLAAALVVAALPAGPQTALHEARSFFGISRVYEDPATRKIVFVSGSTLHGFQSTDTADRLEPTSYYNRTGPLGDLFRRLGGRIGDRNVAVIGLGVGTVACYGPPSASWLFYEIDPAVLRIATDSGLFTFLRDCQKEARLVLGDGRLKFAESRDRQALVILDAFSSDSVPAHLLTREAFLLYLDRLAPDGVIAVHVSNRFVDLRPTLATLARHVGLSAATRRAGEDGRLSRESEWVAMSRDAGFVDGLVRDAGWTRLPGTPDASEGAGAPLWTDDSTEILGPLLARLRRTD